MVFTIGNGIPPTLREVLMSLTKESELIALSFFSIESCHGSVEVAVVDWEVLQPAAAPIAIPRPNPVAPVAVVIIDESISSPVSITVSMGDTVVDEDDTVDAAEGGAAIAASVKSFFVKPKLNFDLVLRLKYLLSHLPNFMAGCWTCSDFKCGTCCPLDSSPSTLFLLISSSTCL